MTAFGLGGPGRDATLTRIRPLPRAIPYEGVVMAGHSQWANIEHRKGVQDAKRGNIFIHA